MKNVSIVALFAPLLLGSCVRPYSPPTAAEPHAVVKLRRVYETRGGVSLRETALIDSNVAFSETVPTAEVDTARVGAILVHPTPATFSLGGQFFHTEMQMVHESYTVQIPYTTTESYNCGGYGSASGGYQSCTRTVTQYRTETRYRDVMKPVEVSDGACTANLDFWPEDHRTYLLQLTYQEDGACALHCYEQATSATGEVANAPCRPAPPKRD